MRRDGEDLSPDFEAKLIASGPLTSGRGWHGAASSFEDEPILLRITVACLPKGRVGRYDVKTRDLVPDGSFQVDGSLGCGRGKRMVTGGVLWNPGPGGPAPTGADNLLRSTPSLDGKRWRAAGFSFSSPDHRLRLVVLCRPAGDVGRFVTRYRDIPGDGDRGGRVSCPSGRRALSGGADWRLDGASSKLGSLNSSTVRSSLKGWYAAGDSSEPGIQLRVLVVCGPD